MPILPRVKLTIPWFGKYQRHYLNGSGNEEPAIKHVFEEVELVNKSLTNMQSVRNMAFRLTFAEN